MTRLRRDAVEAALLCAARGAGLAAFPTLTAAQWDTVVDRAIALGIAGHLHVAVARDLRAAPVPARARERLATHYYGIGARNAVLLAALAEVLQAFRTANIDVVVLKGAALTERVHANLAVRPMYDLDILVREEDLRAAPGVLESCGFRIDERYRPAAWFEANLHHLAPFKRETITVEVHRALLPAWVPRAVPVEAIWDRTVPENIAGVPTRVLAPADLIAHLVLHLTRSHQFLNGLARLRDVAEASRVYGPRIDWSVVEAHAGGVERALLLGLRAAADTFGAEVPAATLDRLRVQAGLDARSERRLLRLVTPLLHSTDDGARVPNWLRIAMVDEFLTPRPLWERPWRLARTIAMVLHSRPDGVGPGRVLDAAWRRLRRAPRP